VLDVQLPGLSGLELQQELGKAKAHLPIIFITGHGDIPMTVRAMKAGAVDFLTKPFRDEDLLNAVAQAMHCDRQMALDKYPRAAEPPYAEDDGRHNMNFNFSEIVGHGEALRRVLKEVETVAPTDATVLLQGETGTGKELLARALHRLSPRHTHNFVTLNCAAIPPDLLESELFGHENAPSRAPSRSAWGALNWPTRERSSSTRSGTSRWRCNPNSCGCCKSTRSSAWALHARCA
jgi:DNA-binding NtrC family response regulator